MEYKFNVDTKSGERCSCCTVQGRVWVSRRKSYTSTGMRTNGFSWITRVCCNKAEFVIIRKTYPNHQLLNGHFPNNIFQIFFVFSQFVFSRSQFFPFFNDFFFVLNDFFFFSWVSIGLVSGPDYAEKHKRMGPGGCFCHFDNAPQGGDSAGVVGAAQSNHHPAPNARPRQPPIFAVSNTAMEAEDDPGRSTSETSGSQFTI